MIDRTPMDMNSLKPFHLHKKSPMEELLEFKKDHMLSLCTPSISNTYSICVEYMRKWFKNNFQDGYFKSEFIAGKNILADYLHSDILDYIKRNKPALMISPRLDYEYNADMTDQYMWGRNTYVNRARFKDAFFKDPISKNLLSIEMEQLKVDFTFRVKVTTYNHAMDLFKFMQLAFGGSTNTKYIDLDFQVPMSVMLAIAQDSGFEIEDNKIKNPYAFLQYLNKHSRIPFTYKFRGTKGEYEFYIRITDVYMHLRQTNLELGEGEREGQLDVNFIIDMGVECLFPAPKYYAYYSKIQHHFENNRGEPKFTFHNMCFDAVPTQNDKGWSQYMTTDYMEDEECFLKDKPTTIHFADAIKSPQTHYSLFDICEYTKSIFITPESFIDIHLYNCTSRKPIHIDWNTYTITTDTPLKEPLSQLVFYIDLDYINTFVINNSKGYSTRIKEQKDDVNRRTT